MQASSCCDHQDPSSRLGIYIYSGLVPRNPSRRGFPACGPFPSFHRHQQHFSRHFPAKHPTFCLLTFPSKSRFTLSYPFPSSSFSPQAPIPPGQENFSRRELPSLPAKKTLPAKNYLPFLPGKEKSTPSKRYRLFLLTHHVVHRCALACRS